jgi:hypothetical protein
MISTRRRIAAAEDRNDDTCGHVRAFLEYRRLNAAQRNAGGDRNEPAFQPYLVLRPPSGRRHDSVGVKPLIADLDFAALLADKAFDNNAIRAQLDKQGALAVIQG